MSGSAGVGTEEMPAVPLLRWGNMSNSGPSYLTVGAETLTGWVNQRSVGNVVIQNLDGTIPVNCFSYLSGSKYRFTTQNALPGWVAVEQPMWFVFDPSQSPPPGTVMLYEYQTAPDTYFYSADPEYEAPVDAPAPTSVGYIYKCATAVQRFQSPDGLYNYWSIQPKPTPPAGWIAKGPAFYAFSVPSPHTIPIYSFIGPTTAGGVTEQDQIIDVVTGHQPSGWTQEQGIVGSVAFWAYTNAVTPIGSAPLQHWQSPGSTRNYFTCSPASDGMTQSNPPWTLCETLANVVPVPQPAAGAQAPFYAPPMTINALYGNAPPSADTSQKTTRDSDAYVYCEEHWWGINVYLSHQATSDAANGVSIAGALSAGVAAVTSSSVILAAVMGLISGGLWALSSTLSTIDRGNGIRVSLPWFDLLSYSAFVPPIIIPWAR